MFFMGIKFQVNMKYHLRLCDTVAIFQIWRVFNWLSYGVNELIWH